MNLLRTLGKSFAWPLRQVAEEHDRWLLWAPAAIGAGIVVYFTLPFEPPLWALAATPLLALAVYPARRHSRVLVVLTGLLLAAAGFNAGQLETRTHMAPMLDRDIGPLPVSGRLMVTEVMPDGVRLTLKDPEIGRLPPERTPERIRLRLDDKTLADVPPPGTRIRLMAQAGPFSEPVEPHAYDFRRHAYFMNIGGTGWSHGGIETLDPAPSVPFWDRFSLIFERARRVLTEHVYGRLSGDAAAMTAALLNGEQNSISKDVLQAMRVSGLAHLLSISGIHVSMIGLLVYFPLRALLALIPWVALRFPIKKWAAAAAILSTVFYTLLVGPQAPTLRSTLMTGIMMFAIIADRRAVSMRLVTLSAAIVMLLAPDGVMGPSFQMSFAAVLAMVAVFEKSIDRALTRGRMFGMPEWLGFLWRHAGAIAITSLVATAATTPFSIFHFQTFSFYGVVANMIGIPLTSFWILPCLLLVYLTAPFGADGPFIAAASWGVEWLIGIANVIATWPFALLHVPAMPPTALMAIVAGGLWLCLWRRLWRYLGLIPILLGALYPLYTARPDFMIVDDGSKWAARIGDGRLAVSNVRRDKFTVTQWRQRDGGTEAVGLDALPPQSGLRCDDAGCVYRHGGHVLAMPEVEAAALEDCAQADIVVAPFVIRDCAAKIVIGDPELWRHGAHALYFRDGDVRVEYTREKRGMRPWNAGWKSGYARAED